MSFVSFVENKKKSSFLRRSVTIALSLGLHSLPVSSYFRADGSRSGQAEWFFFFHPEPDKIHTNARILHNTVLPLYFIIERRSLRPCQTSIKTDPEYKPVCIRTQISKECFSLHVMFHSLILPAQNQKQKPKSKFNH